MKFTSSIFILSSLIFPLVSLAQEDDLQAETLYPSKIYKDSGQFEVNFDSVMVEENLIRFINDDEEAGSKGLACRVRIENHTRLTTHIKIRNEYGNMEPVGYLKADSTGEIILISGKVEIYAATEGQSLEWEWRQHCDRDDPYIIILSEETQMEKK
jgi:hypothetical protein